MKALLTALMRYLSPPKAETPLLADGYVSEHFHIDEFRCHANGEYPPAGMPPKALLVFLEDIRAHFGVPVTIMSGYRTEAHNKSVGGAVNSRHIKGDAADIKVFGVPASTVYAYANTLIGSKGGVGSYATFTHVDVRGYKARWKG